MEILKANWQAPKGVHAVTTTRFGGYSLPPFDQNNLALHVGDNLDHVLKNRNYLINRLNLPSSPEWLNQTHSRECVVIEEDAYRTADASITRKPNTVLVIMTADCLPILLTNQNGDEIAAIHAGWRGLANGIIESTLTKMNSKPDTLLAWIGPAICQKCYTTGKEVYEQFIHNYPFSASDFISQNDVFLANLPGIAKQILEQQGIRVSQSGVCTFEDSSRYFSYRQEKQTGRIASLIWFNKESL